MTELLLVAAAALVDADGRVLLAQRPDTKAHPLMWEFPGGKLEPGETPEKALIRELAEELDIKVTESCLAPIAFASMALETVHILMPLFLCRKWEGIPQALDVAKVSWVRPQRLLSYDLVPADRPLAAQLRDFLGKV